MRPTGQRGKSTNRLSLVLLVFLGTGLSIALAILLTPEKPLSHEDQTEGQPQLKKPIVLGSNPTTERLVPFPATDNEVTVEGLQTELLAMAERLDSEFSSSVDGLHAAAMTFAEFKQTKRAEETWRKCLALNPVEVGPYVGLAAVLSQRGDDEQAVTLLRDALESGKKSAELMSEIAKGLSNLGELELADAVLKEGVEFFPDCVEIWAQRGTVDMQLQRIESAETAFRKAIELGGDSKSLQIMLANSLTRQGKTQEAQQLPSNTKISNPIPSKDQLPTFEITYLKTLKGLAVRLFQIGSQAAIANGKPLLAEEWLLRTIAIEPSDLSTYMDLSAVYRRTNRLKEALEVQERLLELQPKNVLNHINLASVASQLGRYDLAERVLSEATVISPEVAFPFAELARIHLGKREWSKAKQQITKARNLEPRNVEWHVMGAMVAEALGDAQGVIQCLKLALAITPEDNNLHAMLKAAEAVQKKQGLER